MWTFPINSSRAVILGHLRLGFEKKMLIILIKDTHLYMKNENESEESSQIQGLENWMRDVPASACSFS